MSSEAAPVTHVFSVPRIRLGLIVLVVAALELVCRAGLVDRLTLIAPSEMVVAL